MTTLKYPRELFSRKEVMIVRQKMSYPYFWRLGATKKDWKLVFKPKW